ncbi:type I restriction enzyme, S subunit [Flavobacterium psychrophilum DSM 3660]|nr:type I restriction enzyme, S subunit [Flavobacterium psychrophilum DSM 3660] [Flavobacterium psychrophilum DSM 3660 = ATCC 49418]
MTYQLPKGWEIVKLGEVAIIVTGNTPPTNNKSYFNGDVPFFKPSDLNLGYVNDSKDKLSVLGKEFSRTLPKGSILVTCIGSTIGKSGIILKEGAFNQQINGVLPIISNPLFFYYQIISSNFQKLIKENSSATTVPILNKSKFGKLTFLMAPLNEQNLIVEKIEELFSELYQAEKVLQNTKQQLEIYKQALLKSAFEGKLTENWRNNNQNFDANLELADIKDKRKSKYQIEIQEGIKKNPKINYNFVFEKNTVLQTWANANLDNLIGINARIGWRGLTKKEYTKEGALFLSVHALNYGKNVVFKDANHITIERYEESPEIKLKTNDILLCKDGAGIGKIGIIKNLPKKATVNSSILVIDAKEVFNPDFLYYFFLGPTMQELVNEKISGSAIPHLFQKDIKKFNLKVPPRLEQNRIVEILESRFTLIENLEKSISHTLSGILILRHSILKKAFDGKLVNQDFNDESASELLNKIKVEKSAYLKAQQALEKLKPKKKRQMETKRTVLEILKESKDPISVQELWENSVHEGDIEGFYSEIKEIYSELTEVKEEMESLLSLRK